MRTGHPSSPSLKLPRAGHAATLLDDDTIALVGGRRVVASDRRDRCDFDDPCSLAACELFDLQTMTSREIASMRVAREGALVHATDRGLIVVGGIFSGGACNKMVGACEAWDRLTDVWSALPPLLCGLGASGTRLADGRFLVAGGMADSIHGDAWMFEPTRNEWLPPTALRDPRYLHATALLPDGRLLAAGGLGAREDGELFALSSCELFDPKTESWTRTGSMTDARCDHSLTVLGDGSVLAIGGYGEGDGFLPLAERWDPMTGLWSKSGSTHVARCAHTATLLPDGDVVVAGGFGGWIGSGAPATNAIEVFSTSRGTFEMVGSMNGLRAGHSAVLRGSEILFIGGSDGADALSSVESWSETAS